MAAQHSDPLSPTLQLQLERADRAQRDEFVAGLARRMRDVPLPPRHTRTTLRPLAWKVYVAGIACTCVVTVYSITPRPRSHSAERHWFASIQEARAKFPQAQMLDDVPRVAPRLQDKGPENTDNLPDCKFCGNTRVSPGTTLPCPDCVGDIAKASRLIVDLEMESRRRRRG